MQSTTQENDMGRSAYYAFYGDDGYVQATLEDIENVILNGGVDPDGISSCTWIKELASEDLPMELFQIIIKNKDNPAFEELYNHLVWTIEGITDENMR
jgi:hypothetical protein